MDLLKPKSCCHIVETQKNSSSVPAGEARNSLSERPETALPTLEECAACSLMGNNFNTSGRAWQ